MRWRGTSADPSNSADHTGAAVVALFPFGLVGVLLVLAGDPAGWIGVGLMGVLLAAVGALTLRTRTP